MLMCALLCSTDAISALSIVSEEEQPKLQILLYGEAIINDAVSIVIFNSVREYQTELTSGDISLGTILTMTWDYLKLSFNSLAIGILYAVITSLILKNFRSISKEATSECILVFCFGYICYMTAEILKLSGVIALLSCGVVMGHYVWYNLSPQGKHGSPFVFNFMGEAVHGLIFAYLGLTLFSFSDYKWSLQLCSF